VAILIDSDVIIRAERGLFDLDRWLDSQPEEEFKLAAITIAELWHGAERATGQHRVKRESFLRRIFAIYDCVPYDEEASFEHARLWAALEASGQMIGPHDLILAATATRSGNAVATFNTRHFSVVEGLRVIEPSNIL
jgi:tRNA(fMet)-specific endonuclease VapC